LEQEDSMEVFEQYSLINQKLWTKFLKSLEVGEHTFVFPSIPDMKSCKAIGYGLNGDKLGRAYRFCMNKDDKRITIKVIAI